MLYELAKETVVLTAFFLIIEMTVIGILHMIRDIFRLCRNKWKAWRHPDEAETEKE